MIILCIKIFLARILDVTIGTIKTINIIKGHKLKSSIYSFFEIIIWFYAARTALTSKESSLLIAIFYALGYSTGTYIGIYLNSKLEHKKKAISTSH